MRSIGHLPIPIPYILPEALRNYVGIKGAQTERYSCTSIPHHPPVTDGLCALANMTTRYSDKPSEVEGYPQRSWSIEVYLVNDKGEQVPATLFDKVTYHLHPSFGDRAVQCKSRIAQLSSPCGCA